MSCHARLSLLDKLASDAEGLMLFDSCVVLQAVSDPFIWVPNGIGGIISIFLIALTIMYKAVPLQSPTASTAGLAEPLTRNS